jgi:hypothetical protein
MKKRLKVKLLKSKLILFFLLFSTLLVIALDSCTENISINAKSIDKTEENKLINSKFIDYKKEGTDSFYQNTKYLKFPKDSIIIDSFDGDRIKFSIDFTKGVWKKDHWEYKVSAKDIVQLSSVHYLIGDKQFYFQPDYNLLSNETITIDGIDYVQENYSRASNYNITMKKNELIFISSKDKIDPMISTWNNGSRNYQYDFEENDITQQLYDSAGNPSNHNGTIVDGTDYNYVTGASGEGYAGNFSSVSFFNTANYGLWDTIDEFEVSFAMKHYNAEAGEYVVVSVDGDQFRVKLKTGRIELRMKGGTTECNIGWYEYSTFITDDTWHYITAGYNGTSCYVYNNVTNQMRDEPAAGSQMDGSASFFRIGQDNSQEYEGSLDCLTVHVENTLTESARQDAYNDCFGIGGGEPPASPTTILKTAVQVIIQNMKSYWE